MFERHQTADLAIPYHAIPRVDERFEMGPDSYVDLMLPSTVNDRVRLRLFDVNDRWLRAVDLSTYPVNRVPEGDALLDAPHAAFDIFELDEPFFVGRGENNPDGLPMLENPTVSREHFSLTVSLGHRGIILAIRDMTSHNGTELIKNGSLAPVDDRSPVGVLV